VLFTSLSAGFFDESNFQVFSFFIKTRQALLIFAFLGVALSASGMDRWAALSMIESGDDNSAVGPGGEISCFQIQRDLWPGGDPQDRQLALVVAQEVMRQRLSKFQQSHKRDVTAFEFYVLWNAPYQVNHPTTIVAERARRFANLVELVPR
jgi:hypothetical protein